MRRSLMAGLAMLLAACATPNLPVTQQPSLLPPLDAPWSLQGRIALKAGDKSLSGQLQWHHRKDRDELLLSSPLGQGVARLVSDADGVLLDIPNEPPRRAPNAETLTQDAMGVALPLAGLRYWIEARPDLMRPFEQSLDDGGRVAHIRQDGWVIDYLQYMNAPAYRPRKLNVAREALEIRLVIDSWTTE
jgi:outer membrane lipoprotein LolB